MGEVRREGKVRTDEGKGKGERASDESDDVPSSSCFDSVARLSGEKICSGDMNDSAV